MLSAERVMEGKTQSEKPIAAAPTRVPRENLDEKTVLTPGRFELLRPCD